MGGPLLPQDRPLSARSTLLSLVLGAPTGGMTASELVRAGELFGIAEPTVRVALTRAVAAGELRRGVTSPEAPAYEPGERLRARRVRQQERDLLVDWDGSWELAVVTASGRSGRERAALRGRLSAARLAELREGVWMRPANLARPGPDEPAGVLRLLRVHPVEDASELAADLWDLDAWASAARATLADLAVTLEPVRRLVVAATLVRLLAEDPLLPPELLPPDWPAAEARARYADYQRELHALVTA